MFPDLDPLAHADRHALAVARVELPVGGDGEQRATFRSLVIPPPYAWKHTGRVEHVPRPQVAERAVLIDVDLMRVSVARIAKVAGPGEQLTSRVPRVGQHPQRGRPIDVDLGLGPEARQEIERLHER